MITGLRKGEAVAVHPGDDLAEGIKVQTFESAQGQPDQAAEQPKDQKQQPLAEKNAGRGEGDRGQKEENASQNAEKRIEKTKPTASSRVRGGKSPRQNRKNRISEIRPLISDRPAERESAFSQSISIRLHGSSYGSLRSIPTPRRKRSARKR